MKVAFMDASARIASPQTRNRAQTLGVSIAEWRFEMRLGHETLCDGALEPALTHYERAALVAAGLAKLAQDGAFDSDCAVRALKEARENVADVCLRLNRPEQAVATLELLFWPYAPAPAHPWPQQPIGAPASEACQGRLRR